MLSIFFSHSHSIPDLLPDKFDTYVDGGNIGNPRINPPSSGAKPNRIPSIRDFHLHVIRDHIPHPNKGLIYRFASKPSDIVLAPRTQALSHLWGSLSDSVSLRNASDEVEKRVNVSQTRGSLSQSIIRELNHKYICVDNQTNRAGVGIKRYHKALLDCSHHVSSMIVQYFKPINHLFSMFMDAEEIRIINDAIDLIQSETFLVPNITQKTSVYGAFACRVNSHLATHVDADYTYSATSVHWRGLYHYDDEILCYFAFPRLVIAIPLCSGDVLVFIPNEPHCVSSPVQNADDIYCVSLYLKSDNIGKHDYGIDISSYEEQLLDYYHCNINHCT